MSALSFLSTNTIKPAQSNGMVFVIRCVPDPFTGEVINVGVCAIDGATSKRMVKVISEPGRLQCLYGDSAHHVVSLARVAFESALKGLPPPSDQIVFDAPAPFYNTSAADVLERTFADQVTVALPQRVANTQKQITDDDALGMVGNRIKLLMGLDATVLANTPQVLIQTEKGARPIHIPLQPPNGVGTVRSADYSSQALNTHLMSSVLDLECASRYRNKTHMGLFILRSAHEGKRSAGIDAVIDNISYRSPQSMFIEVSDKDTDLAEAAAYWATHKAA
jgi:hypothetical protein